MDRYAPADNEELLIHAKLEDNFDLPYDSYAPLGISPPAGYANNNNNAPVRLPSTPVTPGSYKCSPGSCTCSPSLLVADMSEDGPYYSPVSPATLPLSRSVSAVSAASVGDSSGLSLWTANNSFAYTFDTTTAPRDFIQGYNAQASFGGVGDVLDMPFRNALRPSQAQPREYTFPSSTTLFTPSPTSVPRSALTEPYPRTASDTHARPAKAKKETTGCVCLAPGCTSTPFKRKADLDRHYQHVHFKEAGQRYQCDYENCRRHTEAFGRLDHFRDHLRVYHREDLEKRGRSDDDAAKNTDQEPSEVSRSWRWWRCPKCLRRVSIKRHGWECPKDRSICQESRKEARLRLKAERERQAVS